MVGGSTVCQRISFDRMPRGGSFRWSAGISRAASAFEIQKRGMATGMAIMGFGGGAMIGAPLADRLMTHFRTAASVGVWQAKPVSSQVRPE